MVTVPVHQEMMTADEFLAQPEKRDASIRELVCGEVIVSNPTMVHNVVSMNLIRALERWIEAGNQRGRLCIPLDVGLDRHNVFVPDLSWYSTVRSPDPHAPPPYPRPDLAIEIRSPSTWRYDIGAKKSTYKRHGLPELWLVDTAAEELLVFRRSTPATRDFDVALELACGEAVESRLVQGFSLPLDELFDLA